MSHGCRKVRLGRSSKQYFKRILMRLYLLTFIAKRGSPSLWRRALYLEARCRKLSQCRTNAGFCWIWVRYILFHAANKNHVKALSQFSAIILKYRWAANPISKLILSTADTWRIHSSVLAYSGCFRRICKWAILGTSIAFDQNKICRSNLKLL